MAVYGLDFYGSSLYGSFYPLEYRVDPFTAVPSSYSSIDLTWSKPSGTVQGFRIVKNMYGFPVDQDDGQVILDTTAGWPGKNLTDHSVTSGAYHYYGFYCLINLDADIWVRAGLTGCLMPSDYGSASQMLDLMPSFYLSSVNQENELEADPIGNPYLVSFMSVIGWGMDYLRTQYDTYLNTNNPWTIPVNDLYNLAEELNLNVNPDIHPYTLRKAVYYNAPINQLRGTSEGIQMELSALTGWSANVTTGVNILLDNDQAALTSPVYTAWSSAEAYNISERVVYGDYIYQCLITGNKGTPPTGTSSASFYWTPVLGETDRTVLLNPVTGNIGTWESLWPDISGGGVATAADLSEIIGILNVTGGAVVRADSGSAYPDARSPWKTYGTSVVTEPGVSYAFNGLYLVNGHSGTTDLWLRSVSRTLADIAASTSLNPDSTQVILDGIPLDNISFFQPWNSETVYEPQQIVTYDNQPFAALRSSVGSVPPYSTIGYSSLDWAPLSFGDRPRVCPSAAYSSSPTQEVYPFIEWYDGNGNFIERVFSRNSSPGSAGVPAGLCFDSFVTGALSSLTGRITDDTANSWTTETGGFTVSPYSGGCAYPTAESARSISTVNLGTANAQVGMTFVTNPAVGWSTGLLVNYAGTSSYLRADMTTLKENNGGVLTILGTYSTPCSAGDRLLVTVNGTAITVYRNNVSVLAVTSSFNESSTIYGIISELT